MSQELLSTFGTSIGEIALIPATGGIFTVHLNYKPTISSEQTDEKMAQVLIWDRKRDGGFPEAKILKQLIRNHIEPEKSLGHSDTPSSKARQVESNGQSASAAISESRDAHIKDESIRSNQEEPCLDCK